MSSLDPDADAALTALAEAQPQWRASSKQERAALASEILGCLRKDQWSQGGWYGEQLKLLKIDPGDAVGRSYLSSERFAFGSIVESFLSTFVASAAPDAKFPAPVLEAPLRVGPPLLNESSPKWVKDTERMVCAGCQKEFSVFNRRHHCRLSGDIFCGTCAPVRSATKYIKEARISNACFDAIPSDEEMLAQATEKAAQSARSRYTVHGPVTLPPSMLGLSFEVWCGPEEESNAPTRWKGGGGKTAADGTVTLTLSAGNQNFLGIIDALDRCLIHGETVLIKHHPLRPWLLEPYAKLLAPLIDRNVIAQVLDNGIPAATALVADPRVGHIHITGAERTASALRTTLDSADKEDVGITAELGCTTPWIVVPGQYTDAELTHAARWIVVSKKVNGGCNCLAGQGVVVARDWPQREAFEAALLSELEKQPTYPVYYPGSRERCRDVREKYASLGRVVEYAKPPLAQPECSDHYTDDDVPALVKCGTFHAGVSEAGEVDDASWIGDAFAVEAFGPILALVDLPCADVESFLPAAVEFCNSPNVIGSLSCCLLAPASVFNDEEAAANVDEALAGLKFGTVAVNTWSVFGYTTVGHGGVWGGHPADGPDGARSGCGFVGNQYELPNVVKQVLRGPPLSTKPSMDISAPPPAIVMDALHASTVSEMSASKIAGLMAMRALQNTVRWIPGLDIGFYGGVNIDSEK